MVDTSNLISYYQCNEASGNLVDAHDYISNDLAENGTVGQQSGKINNARGAFGGAGNNAFGDSTYGYTFSEDNDFSISFWIYRTDSISDDERFFNIVDVGSTHSWYFNARFSSNNKIRVIESKYGSPSDIDVSTADDIPINTWTHVVIVYTQGTNTIQLYVDGNSDNSDTGTDQGATNHTVFYVGDEEGYGNPGFSKGYLDEIALFRKALDSDEVTALYNSGAGLAYPFTVATGTNLQVNIGDAWKDVDGLQVNIGDAWKTVSGMQVNIGDAWKEIF